MVVPLRLGGGTSTTLSAEGIKAVRGRDLLVEDEPPAFAEAVNRLLASPSLAARISQAVRQRAVERYAWSGAARSLESFYRRILRWDAGGRRNRGRPNLPSGS